ncbi:MAG: crotonase/enoyl-CoA hydratase family protein [Ilumatobacteraceae bacterium]
MTYSQIKYDVDDNIATITLNRPDQLNSFTVVMLRELLQALDSTDADDNVRAVIFTGSGRAFCAGADLSAGADTFNYDQIEGATQPKLRRDGGGLLSLRIFNSKKPIIGAINGAAVGVGVTMTLPMDIRIASANAKFGFVFTRRGIVPEACSTWFLPRLVGISRATEWVFTGRVFGAEDALVGGLVRSIHEPSNLIGAARELAREIIDNTAPVSVALSRQMMWRMLGVNHPMYAHRVESRGVQIRGRSSDAQEGVVSFLEKRNAEFGMTISEDFPDIFPDWEEPEFS